MIVFIKRWKIWRGIKIGELQTTCQLAKFKSSTNFLAIRMVYYSGGREGGEVKRGEGGREGGRGGEEGREGGEVKKGGRE